MTSISFKEEKIGAKQQCRKAEELFSREQSSAAEALVGKMLTKHRRWLLLQGQPQAGKTGAFLATMHLMQWSNEDVNINPVIATGMNYNDWLDQTEADIGALEEGGLEFRLAPTLLKNSTLVKDDEVYQQYQGLREQGQEICILVDESHFGTKQGSQRTRLQKFFDQLGVDFNQDYELVEEQLEQLGIYLITISATPYGELARVANHSFPEDCIVKLDVAQSYFSIEKGYTEGTIKGVVPIIDKQTKQLSSSFIDEIERIASDQSLHNKYVIIRDRNIKGIQSQIDQHLSSKGLHYQFKTLDSSSSADYSSAYLENGQSIFSQKPSKLTFLFIKGMLRISVRVATDHVATMWDTNSQNDETCIQSLVGRRCGYGKQHDHDVHIYTNLDAVQRYIELHRDPNQIRRVRSSSIIKTERMWTGSKVTAIPLSDAQCNYIEQISQSQADFKRAVANKDLLLDKIPTLKEYFNQMQIPSTVRSSMTILRECSRYQNETYSELAQRMLEADTLCRVGVGNDVYCRVALCPSQQKLYCWNAGIYQPFEGLLSKSIFSENALYEMKDGQITEELQWDNFIGSWDEENVQATLKQAQQHGTFVYGTKATSAKYKTTYKCSCGHKETRSGKKQRQCPKCPNMMLGETKESRKKHPNLKKVKDNLKIGDRIAIGVLNKNTDQKVYLVGEISELITNEQEQLERGRLWTGEYAATHVCKVVQLSEEGIKIEHLSKTPKTPKDRGKYSRWGRKVLHSLSKDDNSLVDTILADMAKLNQNS